LYTEFARELIRVVEFFYGWHFSRTRDSFTLTGGFDRLVIEVENDRTFLKVTAFIFENRFLKMKLQEACFKYHLRSKNKLKYYQKTLKDQYEQKNIFLKIFKNRFSNI